MGAIEYTPATTGIRTITANADITVYPNPSTEKLYITVPNVNGSLQIVNMSGKIVREQKITNSVSSVDIHGILKGVYFAIWNDGYGQRAVQRIIVE